MSKNRTNTDRTDREAMHRQIPPEPEDPELFAFLAGLFALQARSEKPGLPNAVPDKFPDRVKVCAVFGVAGRDHGPQIWEETWKPMQSPMPTREQLVQFTNDIIATCRRDCTRLGKRTRYGVHAYAQIRGAESIGRYLISCVPGPQEYSEKNPAPSDEEEAGTAKDRLLEMSLSHQRWMMEQFSEATGAIMARQDATIEALTRNLTEANKAHGEAIKLREELLDKSAARARAERKALFWEAQMDQVIGVLKDHVPVVMGYLTKGKAGVAQGLKVFLDSLSPEEGIAVFGEWDPATDTRKTEGILTLEQCAFFLGVMKGQIESTRIGEFAAMLEPAQIAAIQQIVPMAKLAKLMALVQAASGGAAKPNGAAS